MSVYKLKSGRYWTKVQLRSFGDPAYVTVTLVVLAGSGNGVSRYTGFSILGILFAPTNPKLLLAMQYYYNL
jgi:hypothetical protein